MRISWFIVFILFAIVVNAQNPVDFAEIDYRASLIEASSTEELAQKLSTPYNRETEKVRAIFSWIAQHIRYGSGLSNYRLVNSKLNNSDSDQDWKSGDEMTADMVLKYRAAICDGYSKLFKTLCTYAGIRCEVVTGFARGDSRRARFRFNSNHTWNAVFAEGKWQLVDVTWGSGYFTYSNEFIPYLDDYYFFSPPDQFIRDHYPEALKWTLLKNPPAIEEFQQSPFRYKSFIKYRIHSFFPSRGILKPSVGDTLHFVLELADVGRTKNIASDAFFEPGDSTSFQLECSIAPNKQYGNKVEYDYIISTDKLEWINLMYNTDPILRYRLNILNKSCNQEVHNMAKK